jgi:hypothetical protein
MTNVHQPVIIVHLVGGGSAWPTVLVSAVATLVAAFIAFLGAQYLERRRQASEWANREQERQVQFGLSLLSEIQGLLDQLSTVNARNAERLIDSSEDRSAKLAHMARVGSIAEQLKLRSAHFAQRPLYDSLDQVCKVSMTLAGADNFDAAVSETAQLFLAVNTAASNLADERRALLGHPDGSSTGIRQPTFPGLAPGT